MSFLELSFLNALGLVFAGALILIGLITFALYVWQKGNKK